ncbi:MAG: endonuclease/exonuclease/phosphatase family protein [Bradymonadales bacterium]|jgi:endonuclease/exonuclease/phosphatase family metal-dependent hydrolase
MLGARKIIHTVFLMVAALVFFCACVSCTEDTVPRYVLPPKPLPKPRSVMSVASYNLHLFFDTHCDSGACEYGDFEKSPSESQYAEKINDVVSHMRKIDADVFLLQEIENQAVFDDLLRSLGDSYVGVFGETGRSASVDVGVIVRGKILKSRMHRLENPYIDAHMQQRLLARELIEVELELSPEFRAIVFAAHLISKASDLEGIRRVGEARTVREVMDRAAAENPGGLIILGGDLNDTPESEAMQEIIGDGAWELCSADVEPSESLTWKDAYALDHLIYREGESIVYKAKSTRRICNVTPSTGLGLSDHCAIKADFSLKRLAPDV